MEKNTLYYGDNLDVLRRYVGTSSVDLCYIDPPFNSKRNYNQIYNNVGTEDRAQAQAFTDTWIWDIQAEQGFEQILGNDDGRFTTQTVDLIAGLYKVLQQGSLLAYLVSMVLRITEIHRVLKSSGSFYLHCDPTASHYLKLVLDTIFVSQGGEFQNEIIWSYKTGGASRRRFARKHDVLLFYSKSAQGWKFNPQRERSYMMHKYGFKKSAFQVDPETDLQYSMVYARDVLEIPSIGSDSAERLGYPTQKPEALLERVVAASTDVGDIVLDAYCGCGTSITVAQRLGRSWIGIDITYQSIALILKRLEDRFGTTLAGSVVLGGVPRDMASAVALAKKKDDRVRKEFEKWAVLTYSNNRAIINDRKGGDGGIDGTGYFLTKKDGNAKFVFQVKSGSVGRGDIAKFNNDRTREGAELGVFITLQPSTLGMREEASAAGRYTHSLMGRTYNRIQIVTIKEMLEQGRRLEIPMSLEVMKAAQKSAPEEQLGLPDPAVVGQEQFKRKLVTGPIARIKHRTRRPA